MEHYKEKYEIALERAKNIYGASECKDILCTLETVFPELKESEDGMVLKAITKGMCDMAHDYGWSDFGGFPIDVILAWLEKQGEQKTYNEVEPKFHEGEWITNGEYTWKIVEVKPLDYILQSQDGNIVDDSISYVDEQFHSFTIEDAKDGDVLVSQYGKPFIYNGKRDSVHIGSYCGISVTDKFHVSTEKCQWTENVSIYPATKEQSDNLFAKMKEAGYTFDFEKKELNKIEDEIEIPFGAKDSELHEVTYFIPKGFHAEIEDDRVLIKRGKQKPTAWSEEDERAIGIIRIALEHPYDMEGKWDRNFALDWLKSLKQRIGWRNNNE